MQVARWGNSLAIRLPVAVVKALDLKVGDEINLEVVRAHDLVVSKEASSSELLERLRKYRGSLPQNFKFDRLEANAR